MAKNYSTRVGHHCGDIRLVNDLDFYGLVSGTVTVPPRLRFRLHGKIAGDLVVQKNALVAIHGHVGGSVLNYGGNIQVSGVVGGARDFGALENAAAARIAVTGKVTGKTGAGTGQRVKKAHGAETGKKAGWASWIVAGEEPEIAAETSSTSELSMAAVVLAARVQKNYAK